MRKCEISQNTSFEVMQIDLHFHMLRKFLQNAISLTKVFNSVFNSVLSKANLGVQLSLAAIIIQRGASDKNVPVIKSSKELFPTQSPAFPH